MLHEKKTLVVILLFVNAVQEEFHPSVLQCVGHILL